MNPAKLASHRSFPTFSPRISCANSILKKGIVLLITTHEAKGIICSPWHHNPMPRQRRAPRTTCMNIRADLKALLPFVTKIGSKTAAAAANRRKTIWKAGRLSPRNFMMPSFPMLTTKCIKYQEMPVMYACFFDKVPLPAATATELEGLSSALPANRALFGVETLLLGAAKPSCSLKKLVPSKSKAVASMTAPTLRERRAIFAVAEMQTCSARGGTT
mmetsp:Transcript_67815/g.119716  ORF Transcript_67815/g.119716 Transcript_67815/m.119716 type:complete len:217 (-) Transcript_67815:2-652(-)